MKNKYIKTLAFTFAVAFSANTQVLNGGFENWVEEDPDNWMTTNIQVAGIVTVTETSDNHSGAKALHGQVINFNGTAMSPLVQSGDGGTGFPVSQRYGSCDLFYKFSPTSGSGDRFSVNVVLQKDGDAIGYGAVALTNAVSSYTSLSVPLSYSGTETPDTVIIQITIIGPTGSDYHVGSEMFADDISLNGTASIADLSQAAHHKIFPNPANETITISMDNAQQGELELVDLLGNKLRTIQIDQQAATKFYELNVENLPSGSYFYIFNTKESSFRGKFSVKH